MITTLQQEMKKYSTQKEFERAAKIRDTLFALQGIAEKQKVVDANQHTDEDVIAYSVIAPVLYVTILKIRGGKLIQQENLTFTLPLNSFPSPSDIVERIVEEYYSMTTDIPRTIILPVDLSNQKSFEAWLSQQAERKVTLLSPEKGKKQYLLHLCQKNVESFAHQEQFKVVSMTGIKPEMGIKELAKILGYKKPLHRIECYDISHLAGKFTVASMVVFTDGVPDKKQYRQFKINMPSGRIDDYQALKETLERRLKYIVNPMMKKMIKDKKESFLQKPDLIVLDGGKGQLSIGVQVLSHLSLLHKIQLLSIAKEEEKIFSPHQQQPITLAKDSQGQYLIERLRDEAHRFANTFHRKLRTKEIKTSRLDSISGMGTVTKKKLITAFGSVQNAQRAEIQDLEKVVGKRLAQEIKEKL
jgi:excinuclease ABC subunit C